MPVCLSQERGGGVTRGHSLPASAKHRVTYGRFKAKLAEVLHGQELDRPQSRLDGKPLSREGLSPRRSLGPGGTSDRRSIPARRSLGTRGGRAQEEGGGHKAGELEHGSRLPLRGC